MQRALDVFPSSADLNCVYADLLYFLRRDAKRAHAHYVKALESDHEHVAAASGLATTMLVLGVDHPNASQNRSDGSSEAPTAGKTFADRTGVDAAPDPGDRDCRSPHLTTPARVAPCNTTTLADAAHGLSPCCLWS